MPIDIATNPCFRWTDEREEVGRERWRDRQIDRDRQHADVV